MRPKNPRRKVAMGMAAPGASYDPSTIAQMQSAIDDLAGRLQDAYTQLAQKSTFRLGDESDSALNTPVDIQQTPEQESETAQAALHYPEDVSTESPRVGSSERYAREDHVHYYSGEGEVFHYTADSRALLPTSGVEDGAFGYTTSDNRTWQRINSEWVSLIRVYTAETKAELPTNNIEDGSLGVSTDDSKLYTRLGSSWYCLTHAEYLS